jgi:proteasome assembly chaperone 3
MPVPDVSTVSNDLKGLELTLGTELSPFPAKTKEVAGLVNGTPTDLTSTYFADKILITISQGGRLAQWVRMLLHCLSET